MKALSAAAEKGWVKGSADGTFDPNDNITREEAIVIISKVIDSLGVTAAADESVLVKYSDSKNISGWAKTDAAKLISLGIIKGSGKLLNPKANITRNEICTMLVRTMEAYLSK